MLLVKVKYNSRYYNRFYLKIHTLICFFFHASTVAYIYMESMTLVRIKYNEIGGIIDFLGEEKEVGERKRIFM